MSHLLLVIVTILYIGQSLVSFYYGDKPLALIMICYALANVGLIWGMK